MKMTNEDGEKILTEILKRTENVLLVKAKEYVRNDDRMHNFNVGADMKNSIRERIIEDFRLKHEISRKDLLNDLEAGQLPTEEYVSEKYGDIINYFILEEMSVRHRIRMNKNNIQQN